MPLLEISGDCGAGNNDCGAGEMVGLVELVLYFGDSSISLNILISFLGGRNFRNA